VAFIFLSVFFLLVGCSTNETVESKLALPEDLPDFVQKSDIEKVDWNRTVTEFDTGTRDDMVGNKNKIGIIGAELTPNKVEKWLWHFWGIDQGELTVVGYNKDTSKITPVLSDGVWSKDGVGGGKIGGADASLPSNVVLPEVGEWALLVYIDGKLFDILVYEVKE
jgi:hypothetical protein